MDDKDQIEFIVTVDGGLTPDQLTALEEAGHKVLSTQRGHVPVVDEVIVRATDETAAEKRVAEDAGDKPPRGLRARRR